jgi:hypothetical protein
MPKVRVATTEEVVDAEENDGLPESYDDTPLCESFPQIVRPKGYYLNCITIVGLLNVPCPPQ